MLAETLHTLIALAVGSPKEISKGGFGSLDSTGEQFLKVHPQLRDQIELVMFEVSRELVMPRKAIENILDLILPQLVEKIAVPAAVLKHHQATSVSGVGMGLPLGE